MAKEKRYILQSDIIEKKLNRLALEIIENNIEEKELVFAGIEEKGVLLAKKLQKIVKKFAEVKVELLTIQLDKSKPEEIELSAKGGFDDKVIIIMDDVTNSGRTLLYAIKPFLAFHPKKIQTLVLVERSHTQYPISANYKGLSLATTLQEHIIVEATGDHITGAYLA
ncbi:phosphoribosyltransferase family protein [Niabella yanshanensis]|uniref:Phosphoribosyltransferase family protein n=1 Tax=Niabella yanshanensis TaxID=577386 RepID=A0ABZ0W8E5_9BACT|nr:phosphoribosyltransferase family protein [Niabella yanshanensis]WQD39547.1 phosphoribosyltransferase family protein [Niabella yanshanensis]